MHRDGEIAREANRTRDREVQAGGKLRQKKIIPRGSLRGRTVLASACLS
jgi:hypothetical protein